MSEERYSTTGCGVCGRLLADEHMTKHHVRPKVSDETRMICRPCHKQIHVTFTNHELRHEYETLSKIRDHPEMKKFINWIQDTDKVDIQVSESDKVRRWRR